jgi:hypothetical protein
MTLLIILLVVALTMAYLFGIQILNRLDKIAEAAGGKMINEEKRLWCTRGNHYIGNEPYTLLVGVRPTQARLFAYDALRE